jgi:hypothetical protein
MASLGSPPTPSHSGSPPPPPFHSGPHLPFAVEYSSAKASSDVEAILLNFLASRTQSQANLCSVSICLRYSVLVAQNGLKHWVLGS